MSWRLECNIPLLNNLDSNSENFPLVASTVTESLRLCRVPALLRIASVDIEFQADLAEVGHCKHGQVRV